MNSYAINPEADGNFTRILSMPPDAVARIRGSRDFPEIVGTASFYQLKSGVLVAVTAHGLPFSFAPCAANIFALHIHESGTCDGDFTSAGGHFDSAGCPHPAHSGDLPPLFAAGKTAFTAALTDRFNLSDVIGKSVIIHEFTDDFSSDPSGNSGRRIACGVISIQTRYPDGGQRKS